MANERLINRPVKNTPVSADGMFAADSGNGGNEVQVSYGNMITSLDIVTLTGALVAGHVVVGSGGASVDDGGVALAALATIAYADTKLAKAANLTDLVSASAARTALGLGQAAVKSVTDNTKTVVASVTGSFTPGHVLVAGDASGTVADGGSPSPTSGFVDNAVFGGSAGTDLVSSFTSVDLRQLLQFSPGNTWSINSFTDLTCNQAGTYVFYGSIPVSTGGVPTTNGVFSSFAKNGFQGGSGGGMYLSSTNSTIYIICTAIFTCSVSDVITLQAWSNGGWKIQSSASLGPRCNNVVSILRLL
jgi:hypothetical protein